MGVFGEREQGLVCEEEIDERLVAVVAAAADIVEWMGGSGMEGWWAMNSRSGFGLIVVLLFQKVFFSIVTFIFLSPLIINLKIYLKISKANKVWYGILPRGAQY